MPDVTVVRKEVLEEAHKSKFFIHSGSNKMYQDFKKKIWWQGMKKDVTEFLAKCLICQQVKTENQRPSELM